MTPELQEIGTLFYNRNPIVVPKYQRSYSWKDESVNDFIQDLFRGFSGHEGERRDHFFGTIVTVDCVAPGTPSGRKLELVDGQQRLATFQLLYARIAAAQQKLSTIASGLSLAEMSDAASRRCQRILSRYIFLESEEDRRPVTIQRVQLSSADNGYFSEMLKDDICSNTLRESHKRLKKAGKLIDDFIQSNFITSDTSVENQSDMLHDFETHISNHAKIVQITTRSRDEAYTLFQVLNDRGQQLTVADLLRSTVLERCEEIPSFMGECEVIWDEVLTNDTSADEFLKAYYASTMAKRARPQALYDQFRSELLPAGADIKALMLDLRSQSRRYDDIAQGQWPIEDEDDDTGTWQRDRLKFLVRSLKHKLAHPFLLDLFKYCTASDAAWAIHELERVVFRHVNISQQHVNSLDNLYLAQCRALNNGTFNRAGFKSALSELQNEVSVEVFSAKFDQVLRYTRALKSYVLYFLTTVEHYYNWSSADSQGEPVVDDLSIIYDIDELTLEHIYPQNSRRECVDSELETVKHMVGNLTFWPPGPNTRAGRKPFIEKIASYDLARVRLTKDLSALRSWNLIEFQKRQNNLRDRAIRIFRVIPPGAVERI